MRITVALVGAVDGEVAEEADGEVVAVAEVVVGAVVAVAEGGKGETMNAVALR